jgi:hypothetical protein
MLEKLLIEFTKSRAYQTTDHALVEGKNGTVVRKHIGYGFIASEHAEAMQRDYERLPQTTEAFIYVVMIRLMTRRLAAS